MNQTAEVIKSNDANQIVEFNKFENQLAEFKQRYEDVVYDLDDPTQEKQARSDRLAIGKVVARLDETHKELKAPLKRQTDLIDAERKRIKDDLLGVQAKIKNQITEHERKIQEHAEMLQQKVSEIEAFATWESYESPDSVELRKRLEAVKAINIDDSYEHRKADATLARVDAIEVLESCICDAEKREAEAAELEKLRLEFVKREQEERERLIAENARKEAEARAIAAEKAAERAEQEKKEAAAQAIRDKEEAIERERKAAEAREQARVQAEKAAKEAEEAEALRRENNKKHRAAINNAALKGFISGGMKEDQAKLAIELIAKKQIDHITITY